MAKGHRQRLREPPCGSLFVLVTRLIANGSPEAKSAGCMAALKKEKDKMVARKVWDEGAVDEWAKVRVNDKDASVGPIFSIMGEKHAERRVPEADKEYKARIVFAGNNIQTAYGVAPHPRSILGSRGDGIGARDPCDRRTPRLETDGERRRSGVYAGKHRRA